MDERPGAYNRRAEDQSSINVRVAVVLERLAEIDTDHERRIRYVERMLNWALGGIASISFIVMLLKTLK